MLNSVRGCLLLLGLIVLAGCESSEAKYMRLAAEMGAIKQEEKRLLDPLFKKRGLSVGWMDDPSELTTQEERELFVEALEEAVEMRDGDPRLQELSMKRSQIQLQVKAMGRDLTRDFGDVSL